MAKKWTIADGINVNRSTKYTETSNMSIDNDPVYGHAIDTAKHDAESIQEDSVNFSGAMSDEAQKELSDINKLDVSPLNRATTTWHDDIRSGGTHQHNQVNPIIRPEELKVLNETTNSWNEYVKQNLQAQTNFLWTNHVFPLNN